MDLDDDNRDSDDDNCDSDDDNSDYNTRMVVIDEDASRDRLSKSPNYRFEVLTTDEIVQYMDDCIKDVNSVIEIPATTTRILLNHFKWNKLKLIEKYYDGDQEAFFKAAHVINPFKKTTNQSNQLQMETEECEICFSCIPPTMMTGLECGHKFCTNCWREYLTKKIMEEGLGQSISCVAHDCGIITDDVTVMNLITDPQVKLRYQQLITNSFVQCNRSLRWCPSPTGCTYAIKVTYVESYPIECKCGHTFCFECGENWHDPVQCVLLKKWIKTANWISAHTKDCPNCGVPIQKIGGCNSILCGNPSCRHRFIYGKDEKEKTEKRKKGSRLTPARYTHYFNWYFNHRKLEHNLHVLVNRRMEELKELNMLSIDPHFLKKAVDILCQCWQTLMYTQVFAYYLNENNQSIILETNRSDLEMATKQLLEYLECEMTTEELLDTKQKIIDKCWYCETRRKILLDHVHEGYENDLWHFSQ